MSEELNAIPPPSDLEPPTELERLTASVQGWEDETRRAWINAADWQVRAEIAERAIHRFASDIAFIPPWKSAGAEWARKVRELLEAIER